MRCNLKHHMFCYEAYYRNVFLAPAGTCALQVRAQHIVCIDSKATQPWHFSPLIQISSIAIRHLVVALLFIMPVSNSDGISGHRDIAFRNICCFVHTASPCIRCMWSISYQPEGSREKSQPQPWRVQSWEKFIGILRFVYHCWLSKHSFWRRSNVETSLRSVACIPRLRGSAGHIRLRAYCLLTSAISWCVLWVVGDISSLVTGPLVMSTSCHLLLAKVLDIYSHRNTQMADLPLSFVMNHSLGPPWCRSDGHMPL